jgi:hypothetical protein
MSSIYIFLYIKRNSFILIYLLLIGSYPPYSERNFLKLKLLKKYLRSTMSQTRLNDLTTLCIKKYLLRLILTPLLMTFASRNLTRNF